MRLPVFPIVSLMISCLLPTCSRSEILFDATAEWVSDDVRCSTGGVVADFNRDGWLDFAVANGNDMAIEPEVIYFGDALGLSSTPGWTSTDSDYSGHCVAGDLNGDQYPELIVGNYIASPSGFTPTHVKLYSNTNGIISTEPVWMSADLNNTFSVTLGDVDGDGDLDLACANGESYTQQPQANDIYLNHNGILSTTPDWISDDVDCSYDLEFCDFDQDGDLDLAAANSRAPTRVYMNSGHVLETSASWSSNAIDNDNSLTWADIDGDGWQDLLVITNSQIKPSTGKIKIFFNHFGLLESTPSWTALSPGSQLYGSALLCEDLDDDLDLDLVAGSWWSNVVVHENTGTALSKSSTTVSDNSFVIEQFAIWMNLDTQSYQDECRIRISDYRSLVTLPGLKPHAIDRILKNDTELDPSNFCADTSNGCISFPELLEPGDELHILTSRSSDLLLLATSWGDSNARGENYGFRNRSTTPPIERSIAFSSNRTNYSGNDVFDLELTIKNPLESFGADLYILLEVEGLFFFYPQWTQDLSYEAVLIPEFDRIHVPVLDFVFGPSIGYEGMIRFYCALFYPETYELVCGFDSIEMSLY